jgi:hypothetical protein
MQHLEDFWSHLLDLRKAGIFCKSILMHFDAFECIEKRHRCLISILSDVT